MSKNRLICYLIERFESSQTLNLLEKGGVVRQPEVGVTIMQGESREVAALNHRQGPLLPLAEPHASLVQRKIIETKWNLYETIVYFRPGASQPLIRGSEPVEIAKDEIVVIPLRARV